MSWFDIIVLLVLMGAFIRGIQKGLIMQLAGLVALIAGAFFAGRAASIALPYISKIGNISASSATVVSYILAFAIIVFCIKLVGKKLHSLFKALHLSFINKTLGAVLGVLSATIVLSILVNLTIIIDTEETIITKDVKSEALFYTKIQKAVPVIVPYLKKEVWEKYIQERIKSNDVNEQNTPSYTPKTKHLKIQDRQLGTLIF